MAVKARKRRTRTNHPGVKILCRVRKSGEFWVARWRDPDTERHVEISLNSLGKSTHEARREWAIAKSKALGQRKADLETGAPLRTKTALADATRQYLDLCDKRLRPSTAASYRKSVERLTTWAEKAGIQTTESITPAKLAQFRDSILSVSRQRLGIGPLSADTLNHDLRATKTVLMFWRERGLLPSTNREEISSALKRVQGERSRPAFLKSEDIRRLLEACFRHDAETWNLTREEKASGGESDFTKRGRTPRYIPISPFVVFVLLTGTRVGEALSLRWSDVDLSVRDEHGREVGEIVLLPSATKTRHERAIDLAVSPTLRTMLAAMKLRKRPDDQYVFGGPNPFPRSHAEASRKRLIKVYGAPNCDWQSLRQTAATYLTNSPGIFGSASAYRSAKQLGHSVVIAEKAYVGLVKGIPREATDLNTAMGISDLLQRFEAALTGAPIRGELAIASQ